MTPAGIIREVARIAKRARVEIRIQEGKGTGSEDRLGALYLTDLYNDFRFHHDARRRQEDVRRMGNGYRLRTVREVL